MRRGIASAVATCISILLGCVACAALLIAFAASAQEGSRARCRQDALEQWYCPSDGKGVAVVDNLGSVVCAAGSCVQVEDEWQCSAQSGGKAELTPDGPVCDGGCRSPRAADCERI
jgi:hypothetical protein